MANLLHETYGEQTPRTERYCLPEQNIPAWRASGARFPVTGNHRMRKFQSLEFWTEGNQGNEVTAGHPFVPSSASEELRSVARLKSSQKVAKIAKGGLAVL
jgi:hypothetical protein